MKNTKRKNNYRKKNSKSEIKSRRKKKIFKQKGGVDLSKSEKRIKMFDAWEELKKKEGFDDIEEDSKAIAEAKKNTEIVKFMKSLSNAKTNWGLDFTLVNNNWVVTMKHTKVQDLLTILDHSERDIQAKGHGYTLYEYQKQITGLSLGELYKDDVVVKIIGPLRENQFGHKNRTEKIIDGSDKEAQTKIIDHMKRHCIRNMGLDGFYEITLVIDIDKSPSRSSRENLSNDDVEIILKNTNKYTDSFRFGFDFDDSFIVNKVNNPDVKAWRKVETSSGSDGIPKWSDWSEWHDIRSMPIDIKNYKIKKVNAVSLNGKNLERGDLELFMNQEKFLKLRLTPTNLRADPNSPIVEASMDQQVEIKKKPQQILGLRIKKNAENYAVVTSVIPGSIAEKKKIGIDDIITEFNEIRLRGLNINEANSLLENKNTTNIILLGKFKKRPIKEPPVITIDQHISYRKVKLSRKNVNSKFNFDLYWNESKNPSAYTVTKCDPDNLLKVGQVITSINGFPLKEEKDEDEEKRILNFLGNVVYVKVKN
jgi:hypothetical protein